MMMMIFALFSILSSTVVLSSSPGCKERNFVEATGNCVSYPAFGRPCSSIVGGTTVYLGQNRTLATQEAFALELMQVLRANRGLVSDTCIAAGDAFACRTVFPPCIQASPTEGIPRLPCRSFCEAFWAQCQLAFDTFAEVNIVQLKVLNTTDFDFPHCGAKATWQVLPQPADVYGQRIPRGSGPFPAGYIGELRAPVSTGNFKLLNSTVIPVQCSSPDTLPLIPINTAPFLPLLVCPFPFENVNNICQVPCPFPVIPVNDQQSILLAFEIPALLALVACIFVFFDSLWTIAGTQGFHNMLNLRKKFMFSTYEKSTGPTNNENDSTFGSQTNNNQGGSFQPGSKTGGSRGRRRRQALRAATVYSLVGSVLSIVYFFIGPFISLLRGVQVSCGANTTAIDLGTVAQGLADNTDGLCHAQRIAPFFLQMLFNLILYALVQVFMVVTEKNKKMSMWQRQFLQLALFVYCVLIPIAFLIITSQLDHLDKDIVLFISEFTRNSAICVNRITPTQEIILVFSPFIVTGLLITFCSFLVYSHLVLIRKNVKGLTDYKQTKQSSSATALRLLMIRLSILGVCTFLVTLIFISASASLIVSMNDFAPKFNNFLSCQTLSAAQCQNCAPLFLDMRAAIPSSFPFAAQIFAMSSITMLFGFFFCAQSLSRLYKEYQDGVLVLKCSNFIHCRPLNYRPQRLLESSFQTFDPTNKIRAVGDSLVEAGEVVQESCLSLFKKRVQKWRQSMGIHGHRGKVFRFQRARSAQKGAKIQRKFAFVPSSWNSKQDNSSAMSSSQAAAAAAQQQSSAAPAAKWGNQQVQSSYSAANVASSGTWTDGPVWAVSGFSSPDSNNEQPLAWANNPKFPGNSAPAAIWTEKFEVDDNVPRRPPSRCPSI